MARRKKIRIRFTADYFPHICSYEQEKADHDTVYFAYPPTEINKYYRTQRDPAKKSINWHVDIKYITVIHKPTVLISMK